MSEGVEMVEKNTEQVVTVNAEAPEVVVEKVETKEEVKSEKTEEIKSENSEEKPVVVEMDAKEEKKPNWCKRFCKRWFIDAFGGMALGLFCTLIAGLIIKQIGLLFGNTYVGTFLTNVGQIASVLTGAGIGAGIAHALGAPRLVIFCAIVNGFLGANSSAFMKGTLLDGTKVVLTGPGDPISAYISAIIAVEVGLLIAGKTPIDILLVPLASLLSGSIVAGLLGPPIASVISAIGSLIESATRLAPLPMGIIVSVIMGLLLTLPTSSAAIGISIGMTGISAGAACAGCACHMVGFAVASFSDNGWGGLIAQGIGTSMLQIPNLVKAPKILIPPVIASIISGAVSAAVFKLQCNAAGSGMGTSGFVGIIMTFTESYKILGKGKTILGIVVCFILIPAVVSFNISRIMRKKGWIKKGDMAIVSK